MMMSRWTQVLLIALWAASAAAEEASLTGTVVDMNMRPLADARVYIYTAMPRIGVSALCPSCYRDCGKSQSVDAKGRFSLRSLDPALVFDVLAVAPGFQAAFARAVDPQDGPVTIRLMALPSDVADRVISGRVLDPEGRAVVGATVEPSGYHVAGTVGFGNIPGIDRLAITSQTGEFALRIPDAGARLDVRITAKNLAPHIERRLDAAHRREITLAPGSTITGRVVQDGQPAAGVKVAFVQRNRASAGFLGRAEIGTDSEGTFVKTDLARGETYVVYVPMESIPQSAAKSIIVTTSSTGEAVSASDLVIEPGRRISGRVVLPDGVAHPPATELLLVDVLADDWRKVAIGTDGSFRFDSAPTRALRLHIQIPGLELSPQSSGFVDGAVELPPGNDAIDVQLVFVRR